MLNSTQLSYFKLAAYFDTGLFRYFYFLTLLLLYICIVGSNLLLIVVICMNRSLHEPMYMFLCSLFVNELFGSAALFPFLLVQILSDVHTVPVPFCLLQIFCVHCYGTVEYLNLAFMSYDRYLAICFPLQYNRRMTPYNIVTLLSVTWFYAVAACGFMMVLTSSLQLCGNIIYTPYCDNRSVVTLSCFDTSAYNIYGIFSAFGSLVGPLVFILYSYTKILKVCFSGSKQTRQKAVSTCTPHLASVLNFSFGASFQLLQSRLNVNSIPILLRTFLSLYWALSQPLMNPLFYGLNMSKIRILCKNLVFADV